MKILMLADVFYPDTIGGSGRVANSLARELDRKGHEIHIITRGSSAEFPAYQALEENLFVHRFPTPDRESLGLFLAEIKNSLALGRKLTRKIHFDLVCLHQTLVAVGPWISGCFRNIPMVYYYHSPWHVEFLIKKRMDNAEQRKTIQATALVMKWLERRILFKSRNAVVLSTYMSNQLFKIHQYPEERIISIPGGVDLARFRLPDQGKAQAKRAAGLPADKVVFLTVRNLVPRMGLEELLKAFQHSETLRHRALLLIGGKGMLRDRLESMIAEDDLQTTARLLGYIPEEDLPQLYQAADYFVLPTSELEGFGLVILEAMACGTPVLGTPVGAIPEIIAAFDKRLISDSSDWQDLKMKMEEMVNKPEDFTCDPQRCREFVEKNYSWKKTADAFEEKIIKRLK